MGDAFMQLKHIIVNLELVDDSLACIAASINKSSLTEEQRIDRIANMLNIRSNLGYLIQRMKGHQYEQELRTKNV